ncbi:MAG: hypothetical protein R3E77_10450 [Steroidobacteraceae bacterium]
MNARIFVLSFMFVMNMATAHFGVAGDDLGPSANAPRRTQQNDSLPPRQSVQVVLAPGVSQRVELIYPELEPDFSSRLPIADHYGALAEAAHAGDGPAATYLYESMRDCRRAHRTRAALDQAIELMRKRGMLQTADMPTPLTVVGDEPVETLIDRQLLKPFESCFGLNNEQLASAEDWLRRGVELNEPKAAALSYKSAQSNEELINLYWIRLRWGDCYTHSGLSSVFFERWRSAAAAEPSDLLNAYAHQLLFVRLLESARVMELGRIRQRFLNEGQAQLLLLENKLTSDELSAGAQRAAGLLAKQGSRCLPM